MKVSVVLTGLYLLAACWAVATPRVFITGDMEKFTGEEKLRNSSQVLDGALIDLQGARDETIAFQVHLQAQSQPEEGLVVTLDRLKLSSPTATTTAATQPSSPTACTRIEYGRDIQLFLAAYHTTDDASYSWGPEGGQGAQPWKGRAWPDALIPFHDPYDPAHPAVAVPFDIDPAVHRNQTVWVDIHIPPDAAAGDYAGELRLLQHGQVFGQYPVRLKVHGFALQPADAPDAWGELYRETGIMFDSRVKFKEDPAADWALYRRYVQLGHAHGLTLTHRAGEGPVPLTPSGQPATRAQDAWGPDWRLYTPYVGQILNGDLFTAAQGYTGPRAGVGPSFYPAPFPEVFYGQDEILGHLDAHGGTLDPALAATWEANARAFWHEAQAQGWTGVRWLAYMLDEVDGPQDTGEPEDDASATSQRIVQIHQAMAAIQAALDRGADGPGRINLLWTSHANPLSWQGTPADLNGIIGWWAPNAQACDPAFFGPLKEQHPGQTVWFYHAGRPFVGNHSINQNGLDLAMWGPAAWRYGLDGFFIWSAMCFSQPWNAPGFNPYAQPGYNRNDTRWGNGVLLYPGSRLRQAGARHTIAGPVPSMRLKALRRGLQDVQYAKLAARATGSPQAVRAQLSRLIPQALGEIKPAMQATWSQDPQAWARQRAQWVEQIGASVSNKND